MSNRFVLFTAFVLLSTFAQATTREPTMVTRKEQPYVAIRTKAAIQELPALAPRDLSQLYSWLDTHRIKPAGAPFVRYIVVDMEKGLDIEIAVPVAKSISGDSMVTSAVLPAGRYAALTYFGDYSGLGAPNAQLQAWGQEKGLTWKMRKAKTGSEWVSRIEIYETDPKKEHDSTKWETDLMYLVADGKTGK